MMKANFMMFHDEMVEVETVRHKISQLDLSPIMFKLLHDVTEPAWDIRRAEQQVEFYREFLWLNAKYPSLAIVPTKDIDRVWHHHILDTRKYAADCEHVFGYFLHHFPYFGVRSENDRQQMEAAHTHTKALFKRDCGIDLDAAGLTAGSVCGGGGECFATCDRGTNEGQEIAACSFTNISQDRPAA